MTLVDYWTILVKQWKIVVACFVFVGLGAYLVSKFITPVYQSAALVQVAISSSSSQADYNSLLASDQLVQTEAKLATSDPVLRKVASHFPGLTVEQLSKEATATPTLNTQLFEIDVQDPSPIRAAALANDIATTLINQQSQVTQQKNLQAQQQIQADLVKTRQQIDTIATQIATVSAQKGKQSQLAVLQAQLSGLQQHYSQWQALLAQLELTQAQSGDFLLIAQEAQPAQHPVRPNVLINTSAGLLAGLFLGILLAVLFTQIDTRVRTAEALSQLLDWPILATVWRIKNKKKKNGEQLVDPPTHSANVESFRILRTNIGFAAIDKPLHSLVVTSAVPHEGKSTIAANLAIFMAKAGKNTILIDADLRRPIVRNTFHLPVDAMGLSNAIVACSQPQYATSTLSTGQSNTPSPSSFSLNPYLHAVGIPNLLVMPSGPLPPNPSELLDSKAMERLFSELAKCHAEVVLFDTPPLMGLSDTSILASKVDGAVVVVDITRANKKQLKQVKALLTQTGTRICGCVVNKQRQGRNDNAYYYYYSYSAEEENHNMQNGNVPAVPASLVPPMPPTQQ
jgi:Mrp family chromosome partitioning ATPase